MGFEITLEEFLKLIKENIMIIILWIIGSLVVVSTFTFLITGPEYQSSSKIVVNQTEENNDNLTDSDINTNLNLITTYQNIIMEPIILGDVIQETGSDDSITTLREKIEFQNVENSLVFGIEVNDEDPYMAADIANTTASIFQEKIEDILPVESVDILTNAVPSENLNTTNIVFNLSIGLLSGILIGVMHVILKTVLDK